MEVADNEDDSNWPNAVLGCRGLCSNGGTVGIRSKSFFWLKSILFVFVFTGLHFAAAQTANIYLAQSAAGAGTGADCADAKAISFFNASSSWGSASSQIGPGTVAHLCGVITSELSFHGGGASGNVIELLFESGASVQISPGADSSGAINIGSYGNLLIDGGANAPCGWNTAANVSEGSCNGIVENMLYGSPGATCPGGACTTQASSSKGNLIQGNGGSNIEIRNLQVGPSYIHTSTGSGLTDSGGTQGIYLQNGSNINIHDGKCRDAVWCIVLGWGGSSTYTGWTVQNNELYNDSHMTAYAGSGSATLDGLTMSGNYCHDMSNWDTTADDNHANCIHLYGASSSNTYENIVVRNNIMGGTPGADMTAQIFIEAQNTNAHDVDIYNNLLYAVGGLIGGERLLLLNDCTVSSGGNCNVLNNTFYGNSTSNGACEYIGGNGSLTTYIANDENNASSDCYIIAQANLVSFTTADYNVYGLPNGSGSFVTGSSTYDTFAQWKTAVGGDAHSVDSATNLNLSSSYRPNSGSPVIGAGENLTDLCSGNLGSLCADLAGKARPSSGAWDAGAYQYSTGEAPSPPTSVVGVPQQQP